MKLKTVTKPWGYEQHFPDVTTIHNKTISYRAKTLVVYPGHSLSLQYHQHREEHWKILDGSAIIQINNDRYTGYKNTEWFIGKNVKHRIITSNNEHVVIREESFGDVWNEYDIIRIEDQYGREDKNGS